MSKYLATVATALLVAAPALAFDLSMPPSGDNQKASVHQWIGPVEMSVTYSSPHVHAADGTDRHGKIWGGLVPYGYANLGFGTCGEKCPWRGGANENTLFVTSHDLVVQGKPLPAGRYGVHFLPGADEWTVIFSKNSTSWGSFFYDESEDALRVTAKAEKHDYREVLTYEFTERRPDHATLALEWEDLALPIEISMPDVNEVYFHLMEQQLRDSPGFQWNNWVQAAQFLVTKKIHLDVAEKWARKAALDPQIGNENFNSLSALAEALDANGKTDESLTTYRKAWNHPAATIFDLHQEGRRLLQLGKKDLAVEVFQLNAKRHPDVWPVHVGLMRGLAAQGKAKEALEHAKKALAQAPDDVNKKNLQKMIEKLEKGDTSIN